MTDYRIKKEKIKSAVMKLEKYREQNTELGTQGLTFISGGYLEILADARVTYMELEYILIDMKNDYLDMLNLREKYD